MPDHLARRRRTRDAVTGVDLGVSSAATLSSGEKIAAPRPLKAALRRLRIRSRRQSRKVEAAKAAAGIVGRIGKGTHLPASKNRTKGALVLARLQARIARVRRDFTHKLTTRLCRENQALAIEDLNVRGMLANARLARAIADVGFYEFRRQLTYKSERYGTHIVLADRWYPSSKLCSGCGTRNAELALGDRAWTCADCGARHDRDVNGGHQPATARHRHPRGAHGATRGEPGANAWHCRRPGAGGRRGSDACQARARLSGRLGAGRERCAHLHT